MARKVRIEYPGAMYHVMNRGDHQERIFCDDKDWQEFLAALEFQGQAAQAKAEERLASWREGHPFKVRLVARLRAYTTVTAAAPHGNARSFRAPTSSARALANGTPHSQFSPP